MPIIDVFIGLKLFTTEYNPKTGAEDKEPERLAGGNEFPMPNWEELKSLASKNGSVINIFTEDEGTCNNRNFLKSLTSRMRIVIFAGHSWTDGRYLRDGTLQTGGGIRVSQGQSLGTFGITQAKTNSAGQVYGEYSLIPTIKASRFFVFSCNPGRDFPAILRKYLSRGSIGYYTYAGTDSLVWVPSIELAAYVTVASLIVGKESQAVSDANKVLASRQYGYSNGDRLEKVFGTR